MIAALPARTQVKLDTMGAMRALRRIPTLACVATLLAVTACSEPVEPTWPVENLAATTIGDHDAVKMQTLINEAYELTGIEGGEETDRFTVIMLREWHEESGVRVNGLLECIIAVAEREGSQDFDGIGDRCADDWTIRYE